MASDSVSLSLILLLNFCERIKGATPVTLSPSGTASVCSGHQLELICTTTGGFQEWDFRISENGTTITPPGRLVNNQPDLILQALMVNTISFNFSRVSPANSLPLVSKLIVTPATSSINGTEVICTCTDVITESDVSLSTTVLIINETSVVQDHPVVNFASRLEQPESNSINVTLMWNESVDPALFSYYINIIPETTYTFTETSVTVKILFDITYNVSIVATHICGRPTPIINTGLFYLDCEGQRGGINLLDIIDYFSPEAMINTLRDCPPTVTPAEGATPYHVTMDMVMTDVTIIGGVVGSLLGVILFTISVVVIGVILIVARRKGLMNLCKRKPQNECYSYVSNADVELNPSQNYNKQSDSENASRGLVYAEIGQSSSKHQQNQQSRFLDLDDNRIEYAKLNHKALSKQPTIENKTADCMDESLSVSLDNLLIQLRPQVTSKWYQFGVAAGIDKKVLDKFAEQCAPKDCIIEMIDYWLRMQEILPTWKDVSNILKEINLPQLALGIEQVYSTGKLPVEVDMNWIPQFEQDNLAAEPPPPVPPKMTAQYWDKNLSDHDLMNSNDNNHRILLNEPEPDDSAPALPPKPNWYESSSASVPARPPKPSPRAPNHT